MTRPIGDIPDPSEETPDTSEPPFKHPSHLCHNDRLWYLYQVIKSGQPCSCCVGFRMMAVGFAIGILVSIPVWLILFS